jgi:hypothetical protein
MIYRVCEHYYNDDFPTISDIPEECFVCFEIDDCNGLKSISLKNQNLYKNNCTCNGWIHMSCLELWCKKNNTCPICRIKVSINIPNPYNSYIFVIGFRMHNLYLFLFKISKKILKFITILFIFYTSCQIYFSFIFTILINKSIYGYYSYNTYTGFDFANESFIQNITNAN